MVDLQITGMEAPHGIILYQLSTIITNHLITSGNISPLRKQILSLQEFEQLVLMFYI